MITLGGRKPNAQVRGGRTLLNRAPEQRSSRRLAERARPRAVNTAAKTGGHLPLKLGVLDDHLGYFVRRLQVWIFQDFIQKQSRLKIRPAQYSVLAVIEANPGLSQSDIADFLGIERARLARMLDRLERRGLVERRKSPRDRRSHALFLTREGIKMLKSAKAQATRHEADLTAKLGADTRRELIELLRKFES